MRSGAILASLAGALFTSGCRDVEMPPPARLAGPVWSYEVHVDERLDLDVEASFPAGVRGALRIEDAALPYVEHVVVAEGAPEQAERKVDAIRCSSPCRLRYHVRLRAAAEALKDVDVAIAAGGGIFAPPSTWLLRPAEAPQGRYRFHVTLPEGARFATGVRPALVTQPDTYEADASSLEEASFAGFGAIRVHRIAAPDVDVAVAPSLTLTDEVVVRWASAEVAAVSSYLGRVPDDHAMIFVVPGTQEVNRGKTLGDGGSSVFLRLGTAMTATKIMDDWVLAHELIHVGTPSLESAHNWFAEGLATYAEPIARARAGLTTPEKVWGELVDGLKQGLPKPSDRGLEGTTDIDRVYWGGALYFLLADLAIRERTRGARSLDDAVRAWRAAGGTAEAPWPLERLLDDGDRATGTAVLHELYDRLGRAPGSEDLDALWSRLGVQKKGEAVTFDTNAPAATLRAAITRPARRETEPR